MGVAPEPAPVAPCGHLPRRFARALQAEGLTAGAAPEALRDPASDQRRAAQVGTTTRAPTGTREVCSDFGSRLGARRPVRQPAQAEAQAEQQRTRAADHAQ